MMDFGIFRLVQWNFSRYIVLQSLTTPDPDSIELANDRHIESMTRDERFLLEFTMIKSLEGLFNRVFVR
jgi:hypothetical protein